MLKGLDRALTAEMLGVLMAMGHGDDHLICNVNHPAASIAHDTVHGRVIDRAGCDLPRAAEAILSLMSLDTCRRPSNASTGRETRLRGRPHLRPGTLRLIHPAQGRDPTPSRSVPPAGLGGCAVVKSSRRGLRCQVCQEAGR